MHDSRRTKLEQGNREAGPHDEQHGLLGETFGYGASVIRSLYRDFQKYESTGLGHGIDLIEQLFRIRYVLQNVAADDQVEADLCALG